MLYYCAFTWHHTTTPPQVRQRALQLADAGTITATMVKGWYAEAGAGAGFMLLEAESVPALNAFLTPTLDLMSWDVRAIHELPFEQTIQAMRQAG